MSNTSTPNFNQGAPPPPYFYMKPKRSKWWIPVVIIASILLFFIMLFVGAGIIVGSLFNSEPLEVKNNSVLYVHLNYDVNEYTMMGPLSIFTQSKKASFFDVISSIEKAKKDDKIKGIYIKAEKTTLGFAKAIELIETIEDFKKSGKFVYAYFEQGDEKDYMLTLPADKIFMPAEGMAEINGFGASSMFFKGLLNKIGVDFFVCQFEDYKSASEMYSRTSFSDSAKLATREYIDDFYSLFINNIAKYRKLNLAKVNSAVNEGLYTSDSLLAYKFIDGVKVEQQIKEEMAKQAWGKEYNKDKKLRLVSIDDYIISEPYKTEDRFDYENQIAIVYGSGTIIQSDDQQIFSSNTNVNANQFVKNLKKAVDNKRIKAIIIRIDSPGGSVLASEIIWQAIEEAKKVKPVYASMSDLAASGGYYMAIACDTIIAHPATITGSIGVISAIPNFSGTLKELGITVDTINSANNAQFFNLFYPFSEKDKKKFYDLSKVVYYKFLEKVAKSRKMTVEQVRQYAKGRVWTGEKAFHKGLVDVLGDLRATIKIAKRRVGIPDSKEPVIKIYPKPEDDLMTLLSIFGKSSDDTDEMDLSANLNSFSAQLGKSPSFINDLVSSMPPQVQNQLKYTLSLLKLSMDEKVLVAMPNMTDIK